MNKKIATALMSGLMLVFLCINAFATEDSYTFTPYYGYVSFYSSGSTHYASVTTKWNASNITEFDSYFDTYEQEIWLYNYDAQAHALDFSSYQSDLPDNYKDTNVGDHDENHDDQYDEVSLSVGTYTPTQIQANTLYETILTLSNSSNTNTYNRMYKVFSQEGKKILFNTTWNIFSETTSRTIPFMSGYNVPDSRNWYYETEANGNISSAQTSHVGYWNGGENNSTYDYDYWKFIISGTKKLNWKITSSGETYQAMVYNSSGAYVYTFYSNQPNAQYTFSSGTYYFRVSPISTLTPLHTGYNFIMVNN